MPVITPWSDESTQELQSKDAKAQGKSWRNLGVSPLIAHALDEMRFRVPTPIQRQSLSHSLNASPRDLIGMARTGSGKTLAYIIPLLQRLQQRSTDSVGPRALVLCPNRELAIQILRVGKQMARAMRSYKEQDANTEGPCKWALIIGGEDMEKQFEAMSDNPDIVIATPGRFLHVVVEMDMQLRDTSLVVYDEADRLFEMGFDTQLREILRRLPMNKQSLMFSATLPKSLADFARAGLTNPILIRLDTDVKLSPDLKTAFFAIKPQEKQSALLLLLDRIMVAPRTVNREVGKRAQAIIFVSTKHHVDYVHALVQGAGFSSRYLYGSLDQNARKQHLAEFTAGDADLLVVTDIAARGLDIPIINHVINYDFPPTPRHFLHRVGRTARAGRRGSAWTLVTRNDNPYFFDLESFLASSSGEVERLALYSIPQVSLDVKSEYIANSGAMFASRLPDLQKVMVKGERLYERTRERASPAAYKAAKDTHTRFIASEEIVHSLFESSLSGHGEIARSHLLNAVQAYRPQTPQVSGDVIARRVRSKEPTRISLEVRKEPVSRIIARNTFYDQAYAMASGPSGSSDMLSDGVGALGQLEAATFGLGMDEGIDGGAQRASLRKWTRHSATTQLDSNSASAKSAGTVRAESGVNVPTSMQSGRYQAWKMKARRSKKAPDSKGTRADLRSEGRSEVLSAAAVHRHRQEHTQSLISHLPQRLSKNARSEGSRKRKR